MLVVISFTTSAKAGSVLHLLLYLIQGVEHGGVVPVAKFLADVVEGEIGHAADEVHGDLPGVDLVAAPALATEHVLLHAEILADIAR